MKTCQPCGAAAAVDAPHCPACGEASWMPVLVFADVVAIAETLATANAETPAVLVPEASPAPLVPRRRLRGPTNP